MNLRDTFDGGRFEGDRTLRWRSIPANARIVSARATITPIDSKLGAPFAELLKFNGTGEFGATTTKGTLGSIQTSWIEIDFHTRRTLASLTGSFSHATLQVDVGGGTYVEINRAGAFRTPSDPDAAAFFPIDGNSVSLPGLTVAKLKVTNTSTGTVSTAEPVLKSVTISSVPSNVSLRVGELAPFYTHPGEITLPETSSDFGPVLQAALQSAKVENGFFDLPLVIHSDSIARLRVAFDVEFLIEQAPLPDGLPEVVLPFDFSTTAQSPAATLNVEVPPNTRVVPGQTTARIRGAFAETRIAYGPTGEVRTAAAVEVSPASSQAQVFALQLNTEISATAIDLFLECKSAAARLRLDVRGDLDGKPADTSLLAAPVELEVEEQPGKGARWTSVQLPAELVFSGKQRPGVRGRPRYWLVLQSLLGVVAWNVDRVKDTPTDQEAERIPTVQSTRDGGLSWRDTIAMPGTLRDETASAAGPFAAFFRLRTTPKTFKVPLELQVGRDENEVRISLERFEPLGRVDFVLDTELAQGINESLDKAGSKACPETEHLLNKDFERWLRVGADMKPQAEIRFDVPIEQVAFSPDGSLAYVLDEADILIVDAPCNRLLETKISLAIDDPKALVISPDGSRAYVLGGEINNETENGRQKLQVVDLTTNQVLGVPFDLGKDPNDEDAANDLAISPDGVHLIVPLLNTSSPSPNENRVRVIDTAKLDQQLITGLSLTGVMEVKSVAAHNEQERSPMAMAMSRDGSLLYMVTDRDHETDVLTIDAKTITLIGSTIPVGQEASAIAVTPDGAIVAVTNTGDDTLSLIDTRSNRVSTVNVGDAPIDVAISPDGAQAYVLNRTSSSLSIVDLDRHFVSSFQIPVPDAVDQSVALAIAPQGDQLYVANRTDSSSVSFVSPIQFGARLPDEWQLTSGTVKPLCLDQPFHLVAVLGSGTSTTGLSQVVPVAELCIYEFSFWGIAVEVDANEPSGMAEIVWLGNQCNSLGSARVPIKSIVVPPVTVGQPKFLPTAPLLQLHRVRVAAPEGAAQAEIRFTASTGAEAVIDRTSLIATSEALTNSDFKLLENGGLVDWNLSPPVASSFSIITTAEGIQLRNAGATTAELVQTAPAAGGETFILEFQGKAVTASLSQPSPRVELRWLKDDATATGEPTIIEVPTDGLESSTASGTAPDDATGVEIHLSVPARTTLEVRSVSLRFVIPNIVPVTFISQAPGEMIVSDVRIAFQRVEPVAPRIPGRGLCIPTPPDREPGDSDDNCCYCHSCGSEQNVTEFTEVTTASGRPAIKAHCNNCGGELILIGGPAIPGAQPITHSGALFPAPTVIPGSIPPGDAAQLQGTSSSLQLTDIRGIGQARAKQLAEIGIDSVEKLSIATPASIAKIKFITPAVASQLVEQAKDLLRRPVS